MDLHLTPPSGPPAGLPIRCVRLLSAFAMALLIAACAGAGTDVEEGSTRSPAGEAEGRSDESGPNGSTTTSTSPAAELAVSFERLPGITTAGEHGTRESLGDWLTGVPSIQQVSIASTADGQPQPALWLPPGEPGRPLIVALHSWSYGYASRAALPYARWAQREGWGFIRPDFRGPFGRPESTGSDLAVSDVLDAVDFAIANGGVDRDRVFVTGYSGGGMMSLLVAGRHPDRFAGSLAWSPVYDLVDWYDHTQNWGERYPREIRRACGGSPASDPAARQSCSHRSPRTHIAGARRAGVPIYIGHGVEDRVVPLEHSVWALDDLLGGEPASAAVDSHFGPGDPPVVEVRGNDDVTLVLFQGGHDMVYHAGLRWMAELAAQN